MTLLRLTKRPRLLGQVTIETTMLLSSRRALVFLKYSLQ
jgi:hypothetical protein